MEIVDNAGSLDNPDHEPPLDSAGGLSAKWWRREAARITTLLMKTREENNALRTQLYRLREAVEQDAEAQRRS